MKVCFVSHSAFIGGAERALIETIDSLMAHGVECYVILPFSGPLMNELEQRGTVFSIVRNRPWTGWPNTSVKDRIEGALITLGMSILAAWKIRTWKCEIVYSNTITTWIGALAAALLRKPHVWHIHEFGREDHGLSFLYGETISLKLLDSLSSICIANSEAVAEKYKKHVSPSKVNVIYQSVTLTHNAPVVCSPKRFRCVIVGKVSPGKGQEDAVRAVADLIRKGMALELYIIGDGDGYPEYWSHLSALIQESGIAEYVQFTGYSESSFEYMRSANVILTCSRCEAFGRVTVEGMLAGKPIIGSRSGATVELIKDGFNGFLYEPGSHKDLAEKILYVYEHPKAARLMGENGRLWASEHFSQHRYGKNLYGLLSSLLKPSPLRPVEATNARQN